MKQRHQKKLVDLMNSNRVNNHHEFNTQNDRGQLSTQDDSQMVSVIGEAIVSESCQRVLNKGPKFIPTQKFSDRIVTELKISLAHAAYQLRWKTTSDNNTSTPTLSDEIQPPFPKSCPFEGNRYPPPKANATIERKLQVLSEAIDHLILRERAKPSVRHNLSYSDHLSIKEMKKDNNIYIQSDKGGEMVVMSHSHYKSLALQHLSDATTYEKINKNPTSVQEKTVNELWKCATKNSFLPKRLIKRLVTHHSVIAQFYHLPKTHKRILSIRPIVSNINSPCEKMAWFLQQLLVPFLAEVPAHLNNTYELLSRMKALSPSQLKNKLILSLDVVSLYTNVHAQEALDISSEILKAKYRTSVWGISVDSILNILSFILRANSFHFEGTCYNQKRGLAMGSKISPILAIFVMDRIERSSIFLHTLSSPLMFLRYIDDCVVVLDKNSDLSTLVTRLNSIHVSIKFEMDLPRSDGFLPVLDTSLRISEDGQIEHKFFVKEANKGLFINASSAIPKSIKRNAVQCEFSRAQQLCSTDEHRMEAVKVMTKKFTENGYSTSEITRYRRASAKRNAPDKKQFSLCSSVLKVPFISDSFNGKLNRIVKKSGLDIRVVAQPARPLSHLLNKIHRLRKCNKLSCTISDESICLSTNVVYKAACSICSNFYIGSTCPPFHERVAQHLQPSRKTSVYLHAKEVHDQEPRQIFNFSIISRHKDKIRCRIAEALSINKLCPNINRKEEFLDFRGFLL